MYTRWAITDLQSAELRLVYKVQRAHVSLHTIHNQALQFKSVMLKVVYLTKSI